MALVSVTMVNVVKDKVLVDTMIVDTKGLANGMVMVLVAVLS